MLPDLDGFEVCRRLRNDGMRTPVLFLTARDATDDKVRGLTLGGDDYLVKPFSLEELVARISAVLRRSGLMRSRARCCAAPTSRWTTKHTSCAAPGSRCRCRRPSTTCCASSSRTRAACCRSRRSSTTCGSTTSAVTAASSRPTSATCARRSTGSSPVSSRPSAGSGTRSRETVGRDVAACPSRSRAWSWCRSCSWRRR